MTSWSDRPGSPTRAGVQPVLHMHRSRSMSSLDVSGSHCNTLLGWHDVRVDAVDQLGLPVKIMLHFSVMVQCLCIA
jgi:hypothetical protein